MKGWLLDTNIISLLAPKKDGGSKVGLDLAGWLRQNTGRLYISAITVAEIRGGIRKLRRSGGQGRADELDTWLGTVVALYGERVLPVEVETAMIAGDLADQAVESGRHPGLADILVAATAERSRLGLLTANKKHFEHLALSIQVENPLNRLPTGSG